MGEPFASAVAHETSRRWLAAVTTSEVAAPGAPAGTTGAEAALGAESPTALVAMATKEYSAPLVRPDTLHEVAAGSVVLQPSVESASSVTT